MTPEPIMTPSDYPVPLGADTDADASGATEGTGYATAAGGGGTFSNADGSTIGTANAYVGAGAFPANPYAAAPQRRSKRPLAIIAGLMALALLVTGGAGFVVWRHNQRIAAENELAESAARTYRVALGEWNGKLSAIKRPEANDLLNVLYLRRGTKSERTQVQAGCAEFEDYGKQIAALPQPPQLETVDKEIAERVSAYTSASSTASAQQALFDARRSSLSTELEKLATFCGFYDKEWQLLNQRVSSSKKWRVVLWPKGHTETIGDWVYSCDVDEGCLPNTARWPGLVPTFATAFTTPDTRMRDLYRDECPYDALEQECGAIAATWNERVKQDKALEQALKEQSQSDFSAATDVAADFDFTNALAVALTKATDDVYTADAGDPSAIVMYEAVKRNLTSIASAQPVVQDSTGI